ncbi:helix-turn-helix domain-containing protein [Streptomyces alkaliphilus]|uniref:helix-turn-helix domain-containing protein n=1 Tax=Streptomyces alkaliphilus TaxID=1472722 RepID=UPI0011811D1A|nr:XRE family transcriptional regulator [Streptomyces alkaliphilus]MQS05641.1 cupin domain-containing protein [Streptomyces alkaliphilus]
MASAAQAANRAIAYNVRALRTERGWSLQTLAARASVSKGVLLQIEKARTNPSIATLCRLADALGVALARLLRDAENTAVRVVRDGEAARLWEGLPGSSGRLLVGSELPNAIEMWDWRLAAGDRYSGEAHAAGSWEIVYVLRGQLSLDVEGQSVVLHHGDAAVFAADREHSYGNQSNERLHFMMAVLQPEATPVPV